MPDKYKVMAALFHEARKLRVIAIGICKLY